MDIKEIIKEEIAHFLDEYADIYDIFEKRDDVMRQTLHDWMESKPGRKQPWKLVPFPRLRKIWQDAAKFGFIRDTKGLDMIKNRMLTNLIKLDVNTEIMGHSTHYPKDEIEDLGYTMEQFHEKLEDPECEYFTAPNGQWRLSDYGLKPLWEIGQELIKEQDPMRQMMHIDRMLNVVHQRSDLASWFVEGGSPALSQLSSE